MNIEIVTSVVEKTADKATIQTAVHTEGYPVKAFTMVVRKDTMQADKRRIVEAAALVVARQVDTHLKL